MAVLKEEPITIRQPPNTIYDKMVFPGYEFAEFPMGVPVVGGKVMPTPYDEKNKAHPVVIVNSQEELDELLGSGDVTLVERTEGQAGAMRVETEDDVRDRLYIRAEQTGAKIDKRWSVERIEAAIDAASGKSEVV
jgi:hypothetical protein